MFGREPADNIWASIHPLLLFLRKFLVAWILTCGLMSILECYIALCNHGHGRPVRTVEANLEEPWTRDDWPRY
ncbi:hypothetical protein CALCODRAFT_370501 [Calocera cornea HHB12733]|uniref:Uncharacterized protein n=1 Tax=Calocera cornea HHB12733 TaxID=1353952 RepID=A0A165EIN5_9BASI|nr:hypothetical protein CALCODRAFT_370501 [Calocera cornea HHB12733]